jgi:transcription elongation factor GreA
MAQKAQPTFLTREGYQKLESELTYLSTARRSEVANRLREAIEEDQDILESSELEDVRNEQAFLEGRIRMLRGILGNAIIIEDAASCESAGLGCYVTVVNLGDDGLPETYRIVGSAEADPSAGSISNESPLGRELVGRSVGEHVTIDAPDGRMMFKIVAIR